VRKSNKQEVVAILGAGRMGGDIALAFARSGWRVEVVETDPARRAEARKYWKAECRRLRIPGKGMSLHAGIEAVDWKAVDLLVEAVTENLLLKHRLLREIEPRMRRNACIATNTSGLRIGDITRVLKQPERSAGMHFMVPAHVMLAVEVTKGPKTSEATLKRFVAWVKALGKVPVVLRRDVPGMLINRIQHAMFREIYHLMDTGVVTAVDVDRAVRFGFGFRFQILGPIIARDIQGVGLHLTTARNLYPSLYNGRHLPRTVEKLVKAGHLGVRTGRGFYKWDAKKLPGQLRQYTRMLENSLKRLKRVGEPAEF
jgi:3-hydroxybutyryl-CoA dehydrogenase